MEAARPAGRWGDWAPRIWLGADLFALLRLFWLGRYSFDLKHLRLLPICTIFGLAHTFLRYSQSARFGRQIRETRFTQPPIFIIGHWRSGTTLLHELLVLDPRHTCPDTYECFDPCHPLLTERGVKRYFSWMLPANRNIDNMAVGWDRPQEEEFALAMLGAPSPYLDIAFPNRAPLEPESLDLDKLPPRRRELWKRTFLRFLQTITLRDPRRLVLKSPPHTCRIPTLLEMFPEARFIHIVRDPVPVFFSTVNLWKILFRTQGMQTPTYEGIEERVFESFLHVHRRLEATRSLIRPERFHQIRYEDLTRDPVAELRRLYERLDLGDFENLRPHLEKYLAENARYERNKWAPSAEQVAEITRRWGEVIERYGYGRPVAAKASA
jgi:omega-hydroxy-beta-dihydromenaquinone-9 sulfotransferase